MNARPLLTGLFVWLGLFLLAIMPGRGAAAESAAPLPVVEFHLDGPAAAASMEFSGLTWWEDRLVMLPQYPERAGGLYFVKKQSLVERLRGNPNAPLIPVRWEFSDGGLAKSIPGYEGYEAIAFDGDTVYACIESRHNKRMHGWLIKGMVDRERNRIIMDPASKVHLDPPAQLPNMSFEALLVHDGKVYAFFEANGRNVNARAQVQVFSKDLVLTERLGFPALEYRLTDVTAVDETGGFYGLNFFWTGEAELLQPAAEAAGGRPNVSTTVERLVPLRFSENGIERDGPFLPFSGGVLPSNWEGAAMLEDSGTAGGEARDVSTAGPDGGGPLRGVMIITDKYPATRLGFVALP